MRDEKNKIANLAGNLQGLDFILKSQIFLKYFMLSDDFFLNSNKNLLYLFSNNKYGVAW
jgi:hypothetical protein